MASTKKPTRLMALVLSFAALCFEVQAGVDVAPGQTGFEPTTAVVNPQNPSQVAVMRGCQVRISNDFGQTFPVIRNTTLGCNGDPTMAFDSQGRLFISHLSRVGLGNELSVFAGQIADTTTAGALNYTPIQVSTINGSDDDKQWLAADANPTSPFADNLYLVWTEFASPTRIMFSRSTNQGAAWSVPQQLDPGGQGFVWPSHVAVANNGDVYVSYHTNTCGTANTGAVPLLRDGNGGADFAAGMVLQVNNAFAAGQASVTCNVQDNSGDEIPGADFWLQGTVQPWILPDPIDASRVYVVGNDDPNNAYSNGDDGDIVIARSDDFGVTFTVNRVDHGPGQSFAVMPTAHIDQDGKIAVHWYDNRRGLMNTGANANWVGGTPGGNPNFLLDLYGTTSEDGGSTFTNDFRINDAPFDPDVGSGCRFGARSTSNCTERIGEYNGVWTVDAIGYSVWTGNATPPAGPFPADGAGAQTTYFDIFSMDAAHPDRLEPNESVDFAVVADLGINNTYNEPLLSIHSATDVDFFKVVALDSGKLEVSIQFNEIIAVLDVEVFDVAGNIISSSSIVPLQPGSSVAKAVIPVAQGGTYFVKVFDSNAPNEFAPQSTYDLTIVNRAAPVPFGLNLLSTSDTGRFDNDDVTNDDTPTVTAQVDTDDAVAMGIDLLSPAEIASGEAGYAIAVFADGAFAGYASPVAGTTTWEFTFSGGSLSEGARSITARVEVFDPAAPQGRGFGGESGSLGVTLDTVAPPTPGAPDLLASSDDAGIDDDDVTRITTPAFVGTGENNALVRIRADSGLVGQGVLTSGGSYEVTVQPLSDGVYDVTAELEDLAGNVSGASNPLKVTIANQELNLDGDTSGPANSTVQVDLAAGTVAGYPGVASASGLIGIVGIPAVNLDVSGEAMMISGTSGNDHLGYSPTGGQAGNLTRAGSTQVLSFFNVGGTLTLDPLGGSDIVTVNGTAQEDTVIALADVTTTVQVNALKTASLPIGNVERVVINSGQSVDAIDITAFDTVNASFFVDAGAPTSTPRNGDLLAVRDGSGKARLRKQPGGSVANSGSILAEYLRTTGNASRVDYVNVEKVKTIK